MYQSLLSSSSNDSLLIPGLSSISLFNKSRTLSAKTSRWWLLAAFFSPSNGLNILISVQQNSSQRCVIWYASCIGVIFECKVMEKLLFYLELFEQTHEQM